jgi:hypothetical protein
MTQGVINRITAFANGKDKQQCRVKSLPLTLLQREITDQTFTLDFLGFCFVHPARALLNSTPQLLARDRRAVGQGAQLGPGDLRLDAAAQAAVGAGDNVFAADDVGEGDQINKA